MDKTSWDKVKWRLIGTHLGYTKEELEFFKTNPRNEAVLDMGRELQNKRIVIEVVESHGCNSKHRVGGLIFTASELFYAGVDPNEMKFRRSGCFDVGIQCGGWGKVIVELSMTDKG